MSEFSDPDFEPNLEVKIDENQQFNPSSIELNPRTKSSIQYNPIQNWKFNPIQNHRFNQNNTENRSQTVTI